MLGNTTFISRVEHDISLSFVKYQQYYHYFCVLYRLCFGHGLSTSRLNFIHNSWVNLNIELAPENALLPLLTAFVKGNTQGELDPIGKGEVMVETVHFHSAYAKKCCVVLHSSSIYTSLISFTTEHSADFPNRYRRLRIQWFQNGGCL